jgi:hypothetical protein
MINIIIKYPSNSVPPPIDPLFDIYLSHRKSESVSAFEEKSPFPFQLTSIDADLNIFKNPSIIYNSKKHLPLLPMFCSHIVYIFALPNDYRFEDFLKKAERFWTCIRAIRIIYEKTGKYSMMCYFNEQNKAEEFFHVL